MLDMMKGYLQLAAGLGEMSRRKAMDAARELVEGTPVAGLRSAGPVSPDAVAAQVAAVADELLAIGRQNRRLVAQLVRTEAEAVLASLGVRDGSGPHHDAPADQRLDGELRTLRERVDDLERQLRLQAGGRARAVTSSTSRSTGQPSTAARTTPTGKATARKATARKATARKVTARKVTPSPAAGRTASMGTTTARKAATRESATRKAATRKGGGPSSRGQGLGASS